APAKVARRRAPPGCGPLGRGCRTALGSRKVPGVRGRRGVVAAPVGRSREKCFKLPSMLPLLSSLLVYVFSSILDALWHRLDALWHRATIALAPSCGMGTPHLARRARRALRAGSHTRQPFLDAS